MIVLIIISLINIVLSTSFNDKLFKLTSGKVKQVGQLWDKWKYIDQSIINELIEFWFNKHRPELDILSMGKTGVGKSALINSLFEEELTKESDYETGTHDVHKFSKIIDKVKINLWDMPGLYDATKKDIDTLKKLENKIKKLDVILMCIDITDRRMRMEDIDMIDKVSNLFGKNILKHSVIVFTFSNEFNNEDKLIKIFNNKKNILINKLSYLYDYGVPFVLAGYKNNKFLCNNKNWFDELWVTIFEVASLESQPAIVKLNFNKLKDSVSSDQKFKRRIEASVKKNGCFSIDDTVILKNGNIIKINDLKVGDYVKTLDIYTGFISYTRINYIYDHIGYYETYTLITANNKIKLTNNHLVEANFSLTHTKDININDYLSISASKYIHQEQIIDIIKSISQVKYVLTDNNYILVNNILCSVHSYNHNFGIIIGNILKYYQMIKDLFY